MSSPNNDECSGGSSIEEEFLSYLSGNTPPPIPPLLSVVTMVPASARSETNRASVEASVMQATAGLGDASRRTMLAAHMPVDAAPADRAGVPSQAQALLDTAEAAADPGGDGLARSLPQEAVGRRTSDDPPPLDVERYPAPQVPPPLEPSAPPHRGPAHPILRHSSPAERSASRAPDGSWIF